jgi:pimeloyl-ACP methyl ester carboxylesterase
VVSSEVVSEVVSGEVTLSVRELPHADAPTVVLVHGFPDTQAMWDPMAALLRERHGLRVVTYDTRGAGGSTAPAGLSGYRTERLVDDLVAVMDLTCPDGAPVHLVGHDWGSVQLWDAVTTEEVDPRLRGRLASFTSISGPSLDHLAHTVRRARADGRLGLLLRQGVKSWYVYAFQVPWLPELALRTLGGPLRSRLARTQGLEVDHWGESFPDDAAHGLNLYRANSARMRSPREGRTRVPVQLVVPELDPFLEPGLYDDLEDLVPHLSRVDVRAGHWVPRTDPALVAGLVADHVRGVD